MTENGKNRSRKPKDAPASRRGSGKGAPKTVRKERVRDLIMKHQRHGIDRKGLVKLIDPKETPKTKSAVNNAVTRLVNDGDVAEAIAISPGGAKLKMFSRAQIFLATSHARFRETLGENGANPEDEDVHFFKFLRNITKVICERTDGDWARIVRKRDFPELPKAIRNAAKPPEVILSDIEILHSGIEAFDLMVTVQYRNMEMLMYYVRRIINSIPDIERTHTQYVQASMVRADGEEIALAMSDEEETPRKKSPRRKQPLEDQRELFKERGESASG